MKLLGNLRADWLRGWRNISPEGKREYAFVAIIALAIMAACGWVIWFAYIVPFWKVFQRAVS